MTGESLPPAAQMARAPWWRRAVTGRGLAPDTAGRYVQLRGVQPAHAPSVVPPVFAGVRGPKIASAVGPGRTGNHPRRASGAGVPGDGGEAGTLGRPRFRRI